MSKKIIPLLLASSMLCGCSQLGMPVSEVPPGSESEETAQTTAENTMVCTETSVVYSGRSDISSDVSVYTEASDMQVFTEAPASETEAVLSAETVTAQNLLSSEGGNVIVPEQTTAAVQTDRTVLSETSVFPNGENMRSGYSTLNYSRQCGVWFSYIDYDFLMKGCSAEKFEENICRSFDNVLALGVNTVYVQMRAFGDSYYMSDIFPHADILGGYDPLEIMIRCAHDRGLSVHAWINPLRLMNDDRIKLLNSSNIIGKWYAEGGKNMFEYNGKWYLDPSCPEARDLICSGITELLTRYNTDGIHIDDYFYPCTDAYIDSSSYAASGTSLSLGDWRREMVNIMIKQMYDTVHSANPEAVFGISPAGNPESCKNEMYADVYKWCSEKGFCDYICPQLYYGTEHETAPFGDMLALWQSMTSEDISLVAGLSAYKAGCEDSYAGSGRNEWINSHDILSREKALAESAGCGTAFFRYGSLFEPEPTAAEAISREIENLIGKYCSPN